MMIFSELEPTPRVQKCVNGVNPGRSQIYTNVVDEPQRGMRKTLRKNSKCLPVT